MDMKVSICEDVDGNIWRALTLFFIRREDYGKFRKELPSARYIGIGDFEEWTLNGFKFYVHI